VLLRRPQHSILVLPNLLQRQRGEREAKGVRGLHPTDRPSNSIPSQKGHIERLPGCYLNDISHNLLFLYAATCLE
jgi:hypothetical protein